MSSLYAVLGVTRRATDTQIKFAFRMLAKACHPDLHPGDKRAEERFKGINRAYETLRDPQARATYDRACADERARMRRNVVGAAATMSASFLFTLSSGLLVAVWLRSDGLF